MSFVWIIIIIFSIEREVIINHAFICSVKGDIFTFFFVVDRLIVSWLVHQYLWLPLFFFLPNDDGILNPLYSHKKFTILLPVKRVYNFLKLIWKILTSKPHQSFLTHYFQRVNFRIYTHSRKNMFFCLFHTSFSC